MLEESAWIFFAAAVLATYVWRFTAVLISHRINATHPLFEWFSCLAYGIIAALVARTLILPMGLLAQVPLWQRLLPISLAFVSFYLIGKRLWLGILVGETTFIGLLLLNNLCGIG